MDKHLIKAVRRVEMSPTKENIIGVVAMLVLSKFIFKTNFSVSNFIKDAFDISFLDYAIRSRTLMCAKLTRVLVEMDQDLLKKHFSKALFILANNDVDINAKYLINQKSKNTRANAISNMRKWMSGTEDDK